MPRRNPKVRSNAKIPGLRTFAKPDSLAFRAYYAQKRRRDRKKQRDLLLLDQYPGAAAAYSLRRLSADADAVVRVRRSSDNAEQDFTAKEITDGSLTTFCGSGDGFVTTWYDQSGNGNDATQDEAPEFGALVIDGDLVTHNNRPAVRYTSNLQALAIDVAPFSAKTAYLVFDPGYSKECVVYDAPVSGVASALQSFYAQSPNELDGSLGVALLLNYTGAPVVGGYYAGLIDTIAGDIISADDYQTGLRYALIVAPKDLEGGLGASPASGLPTGDLEWDTTRGGGESGCFTRWNGLEATNVIIAKADAKYEVHNFIADVRSQYPAASTPGGSEWYLPAMDELELLYRNFKPNNADNSTDDRSYNFPGNQVPGANPSSDPEGFAYENSPRIPDGTYLDLFKEGNAQSIDLPRYWSTTDSDEEGDSWRQNFTLSGAEGDQFGGGNKTSTLGSVRPVRRVVL